MGHSNSRFTGENPDKIIEFYDSFKNRGDLIEWVKHRPKGIANIYEVDGDNGMSLEAQRAIEILRRYSLDMPVIQSDNGSAFISLDFKIVLNNNGLTQKRIHPHTPEQNGIVERANKTMREELSPLIITDYRNAQDEISRIIRWYNNERMHSSLNYLTPRDYYRGNPDDLLRIREEKIRMGRITRKERNMNRRKGGVMAGATP